jgi:hypothetical protein
LLSIQIYHGILTLDFNHFVILQSIDSFSFLFFLSICSFMIKIDIITIVTIDCLNAYSEHFFYTDDAIWQSIQYNHQLSFLLYIYMYISTRTYVSVDTIDLDPLTLIFYFFFVAFDLICKTDLRRKRNLIHSFLSFTYLFSCQFINTLTCV